MVNPIIGKKTILFQMVDPRQDIRDLFRFVELHRKDTRGYLMKYSLSKMTQEEGLDYAFRLLALGQIMPFVVMTKEGKASRNGGYVYLSDMTETACVLNGVMDTEMMNGLGRVLRKDKYTFSQDFKVINKSQ